MRPTTTIYAVFALLFAFQTLVASNSLLAAAPGDATPLSPGPHPLGGLVPWLECISKSPGTNTAYFGFDNPSLDNIVVPVGANNRFSPDPPNRSQTTTFLPGRSRYFPVYAFSVTFGASSTIKWQLNGYEVTANADSALCNTDWLRFNMIIDSQTAPSASQVAATASEAATQMGIAESRIDTSVKAAGLGKFQIIYNVSSSDDVDDVSTVLAVSSLFGDNTKFSAFVDRAIAVGLAPSATEPMPTGNEVQGEPISAPAPFTPTAPTTPTTTPTPTPTPSTTPVTVPVTPTATPVTPVGPEPTAQSPNSSAASSYDMALFALVVSLALIVFGCFYL